MIYDASTFGEPIRLRTDLCIIGSGAGGSAAAWAAARRGLDVTILEAGPFVPPSTMNQREEDMMPALLYANGSQTSQDRHCTIIQGRALGGSTVHNINLCKPIPRPILREWQDTHGLQHLPLERWQQLYDQVYDDLQISPIDPSEVSRHNRLLKRGADALDWAAGGLEHNRTGCTHSGYCAVGCPYDAKNNATKVYLPWAFEEGAQALVHCRAISLDHDGQRATGVIATAVDPTSRQPTHEVYVEAQHICLSASATHTPAILQRSDIPDPSQRTGQGLTIHPAVVAGGQFDEPVRAWEGIPQSYECTEFLDLDTAHPGPDADAQALDDARQIGLRTWLITAFAHPMSTATILPGFGEQHRTLMESYDHLGVFSAMVHDRVTGSVEPAGDLGVDIHWSPTDRDRQELRFGLKRCVELLLAAGARQAFIPTDPPIAFEPDDDLSPIDALTMDADTMELTAVHPMSSVPMSDDPHIGPVDSRGKHHGLDGLWVADGSLFPTSIGGPPQVSIYALGLHVGQAIADHD